MKLTVVVPMTPSKKLSPNRRVHGRAKADDVATARLSGFYAAREALQGMETPLFTGPVAVFETIWWGKGERRLDLDAIPLMLKNVLDGTCDAGALANDSQVMRLIVEQYRAADGIGKVQIVFEELTA